MTAYELADVIINSLNLLLLIGLAIYGFSTWKNQFSISEDFKIAKKILNLLYEFDLDVKDFRNPYLSPYAIVKIEDEFEFKKIKSSDYANSDVGRNIFENKWSKLQDTYVKYSIVLKEAELILGKIENDTLREIHSIFDELSNANYNVTRHFSDVYRYDLEIDEDFLEKYLQIVSSGYRPESVQSDLMNEKIIDYINKVEDILLPIIKLKKNRH